MKNYDEATNDFLKSLDHTNGKEYVNLLSTQKLKYKTFTISVVGALLIALSYIAGFNNDAIHVDKIHFIVVAVLASVYGLNLIRFLDVNINHEEIRKLFRALIDLENSEDTLPKPYSKISKVLYRKKIDPVVFDFLYYGSINISIIVFGAIILWSKPKPLNSSLEIAVVCSLLLISALRELWVFLSIYRKRMNRKRPSKKT